MDAPEDLVSLHRTTPTCLFRYTPLRSSEVVARETTGLLACRVHIYYRLIRFACLCRPLLNPALSALLLGCPALRKRHLHLRMGLNLTGVPSSHLLLHVVMQPLSSIHRPNGASYVHLLPSICPTPHLLLSTPCGSSLRCTVNPNLKTPHALKQRA